MICKQCGNEMAPDAKFCGVCGAPNDAASQPQYAQPAQPQYGEPAQPQYGQPVQPLYDQSVQPQYDQSVQSPYGQPAQNPFGAPIAAETPEQIAQSKSVLVFGILSLVFCCTFYLSFLGIVFGAIALSKAGKYAASYPLAGRAKVGRILGLVGLILGCVLTLIVVIVIIGAIVVANSSSSYYYYY